MITVICTCYKWMIYCLRSPVGVLSAIDYRPMLMGRALNGISIRRWIFIMPSRLYGTHTHPRKNNLWSVQNWEVMMKGGGGLLQRCGYREYWMIYRGLGFVAVVWFGSSPPSSPPLPSVSSTGRTTDGGVGEARSRIIKAARKPLVLYKLFHTLCAAVPLLHFYSL